MNHPVFLLFIAAFVSAGYAFTDEIIFGVNKAQNLWKAEHNHITRRGLRGIKKLLGTRLDKPLDLPEQKDHHIFGGPFNLPDTFDARMKWPQCPTVASIKDQSTCGSCWAVATAATMSDRLCISTGFSQIRNLSSHYILSCCGKYCGDGCDGGYTTQAVRFMYNQGVVSGGEYGSNEGCQPYQIPPCTSKCTLATTPSCSQSCLNRFYAVPLASDKKFLRTAYSLKKVDAYIMLEIFLNGPVLASYTVYSDFPAYKSGVYKRTSNTVIGGHSIKIIGWGTENGVPYWLVANSWGAKWGQNGFFKILRGSNECRIEEFVIGGKF